MRSMPRPAIRESHKSRPASRRSDYLGAAESIDADLTVVGPEAPLAAGIVDRFRAKGRAIVGRRLRPRDSNRAKLRQGFHVRAGIPTARFITVDSPQKHCGELRKFEFPVVLKADGLAAGKGVIIARSRAGGGERDRSVATRARYLVIEEFLTGEEVSFIVLSDGTNVLPLEPTQDHKAMFDGDTGPNTGGMGAYCDGRILNRCRRSSQ